MHPQISGCIQLSTLLCHLSSFLLRAEAEVSVPLELCWRLWEDRERIPQWMPWIKSVKVLPEEPRLSRWLLSTHQFGR
jgi:uncharacterized membrane protein